MNVTHFEVIICLQFNNMTDSAVYRLQIAFETLVSAAVEEISTTSTNHGSSSNSSSHRRRRRRRRSKSLW